jgi:hypothetical protein
MTIVRSGATKKFADNWDAIFGGKKSSTSKSPSKVKGKKSAKKKAAANKAKPAKSGAKKKAKQ